MQTATTPAPTPDTAQASKTPMLNVSYSSAKTFRECEQEYYLKHVRRLSRKDRPPALELGSVIHTYLEIYYRSLYEKMSAESAHARALISMTEKWLPILLKQAEAAMRADKLEAADTLRDMVDKAQRLMVRYFNIRGRLDATTWEILHIEQFLSVPIGTTIKSNGFVDLIARNLETGRISLWDHKSSVQPLSADRRTMDLQTRIYAYKATKLLDIQIDSITWNNIRTKEPTEPAVLKSGKLGERKDLDSTRETYLAAIQREGLDSEDYEEMLTLLDGREESVFFPRFEVPVGPSRLLLRDYVQTARDIERIRPLWESGERTPIKNVTGNCKRCEFHPICLADIMTGDGLDVIKLRYMENKRRD